jgi:hypothetical protein
MMSINFVVEQTESASTRPPATITSAIIRITAARFLVTTVLHPPRPATRTRGPLVSVRHRAPGAVPNSHLGLDLMLAIPCTKRSTGRGGSIAERHRWAGLRFHLYDCSMIAVLGGLADVERDLIRTRTAKGRSRAQKRGQRMGRPPKLTPAQQSEARRRRAQGVTLAELARSYNVGAATFSRLTVLCDF